MKIPSPGINLQFRIDMEMSGADSGTNGLSFLMRGSRKNGKRADSAKADLPGMSVSTSAPGLNNEDYSSKYFVADNSF